MKIEANLLHVKFLKRYKRFFVDVEHNKKIITAHCPNSGSMLGLLNIGNDSWISKSDNPNRKLKYTLEIINDGKSNVGVNTHAANKIIAEALINKKIKELKTYNDFISEVKYGNNSRFDFQLTNKKTKAFLEVKSVTLSRNKSIAEFPDAVTSRGLKHLNELKDAIKHGFNSYLIYVVQREDCNAFRIAKDIDPDYYKAFIDARENGVKFLCYSCKVNSKEIYINKSIKILY